MNMKCVGLPPSGGQTVAFVIISSLPPQRPCVQVGWGWAIWAEHANMSSTIVLNIHICSNKLYSFNLIQFALVLLQLSLKSHFLLYTTYFISSVRSSSVHHGLLHIRKQATFSNFSNSSDSKVKVKVKGPNMCYIFEKHGIQGYRI